MNAVDADDWPPLRFRLTHILAAMGLLAAGLSAFSSYQSVYESYPMGVLLFPVAVGVLLIFAPLLAVARFRRRIIMGAMTVFIAFTLLGWLCNRQFDRMHGEVQRIIAYLDEYKSEFGAYPPSLKGYKFSDSPLADRIYYEPCRARNSTPSYWIQWSRSGDRSWGHVYSPEFGHLFEDD